LVLREVLEFRAAEVVQVLRAMAERRGEALAEAVAAIAAVTVMRRVP
jgi:hypothetical protein